MSLTRTLYLGFILDFLSCLFLSESKKPGFYFPVYLFVQPQCMCKAVSKYITCEK